eukprot:2067547-Pyramimonas_sp.AAC.1
MASAIAFCFAGASPALEINLCISPKLNAATNQSSMDDAYGSHTLVSRSFFISSSSFNTS